MKATEDQVAAVLSRLWGCCPLQRGVAMTTDYANYEWVDQVPELGRQLADALAAEGLEIGGFLRTDQG